MSGECEECGEHCLDCKCKFMHYKSDEYAENVLRTIASKVVLEKKLDLEMLLWLDSFTDMTSEVAKSLRHKEEVSRCKMQVPNCS